MNLKNVAVIFATGNNLVIGGDLSTRALRCDIDEKCEHPESRKFEFDPVRRAIEHHPKLVMAACLALRAFILAGSPWTPRREPWGGFEEWDKLICGCLTWLGYADPYEARERIIKDDPIRSASGELLEVWFKKYGDRPVSLNEIKADFTQNEVYDMLLKDNRWDGHHVQWILRKMQNKVVDSFRLRRLEGRGRFCVEQVPKELF